MQRYDHTLIYIGTGEYISGMEPSDDGEFYLASDVDAALAEKDRRIAELEDSIKAICGGDAATREGSGLCFRRRGDD